MYKNNKPQTLTRYLKEGGVVLEVGESLSDQLEHHIKNIKGERWAIRTMIMTDSII